MCTLYQKGRPLLPKPRYLDSGFGQVDLHCQFLPGEHVGVVSLSEHGFQRFQLQCKHTVHLQRNTPSHTITGPGSPSASLHRQCIPKVTPKYRTVSSGCFYSQTDQNLCFVYMCVYVSVGEREGERRVKLATIPK